MKVLCKIILSLLFIPLFAIKTYAQIDLEHTFNGNLQPIILNGEISYYYDASDISNNIKIYDDNFNLYKNINITSPDNYNIQSSSITISTNNDLLIIASFINSNASNMNEQSIHRIYDFDGSIIKDFGKSYNSSIIFYFDKILRYKITIDSNNNISYTTEIYSNPFVTSLNETTNNNFSFPFPNPANNIITLPYNIKTANSEMYIYDVNGKLIEKKSIDSSSDKILLNIEGYTPGLYLYTIDGITQKFIVK